MAAPPKPAVSEEAIAEAVAQMSPAEAAYFLDKLSAALRRRKLQLVGYLVAAVGGFLGMVLAFVVYGTRTPGEFVGWVFIVPLGLIGLSLLVFGRLADRAGADLAPPPASPARRTSP